MEKPKINNYNSLENTDENREKFVQEFNKKVLDLDFLENSDNAFKMTKNLKMVKKLIFIPFIRAILIYSSRRLF